jgi:hypothetical protein
MIGGTPWPRSLGVAAGRDSCGWTRSPAAGQFASNGLRQLAAGIAIGLLAAGAAACAAAGFGLLKQGKSAARRAFTRKNDSV